MKRLIFIFSIFSLLAFSFKPSKTVIGSYSKFSDFYGCGKQEILLFNDSTFLYRSFYRKAVKQKYGKYFLTKDGVKFSSCRNIRRKVDFTISAMNNNFFKDSLIVFQDREYFKSNHIGAPCIFTNDSIIFNYK